MRRRPNGFAGQTAENGKKKKFPWGTVFLTGAVTAIGSIVAYKLYETATKKRELDSDLEAQRNALLGNPGSHAIASGAPIAVQPVTNSSRQVVISEEALLQLTQGQVH